MYKLNKRILSALMALLLVVSLLSGLTLTASAATVDYQYGDTERYSNVIKNWGTREEIATFLSPNAEKFYSDTTYEELVVLDAGPLYTALYMLMSEAHTTRTKYDYTNDAYRLTDCQNNGEQSLTSSGFYSGLALPPKWDGGLSWNREHTWPQSKTTKGDEIGDIMSIRPELGTVNSGRGNTAYGESSGYYNPNKSASYDVRGDAARVILYTYVRWGGESEMSTNIKENLWGTKGVFESEEVLLKWIKEDPVDTWEMGRNDSVESITGTRNVFVDYPELAFVLFDEEIPDMDTPSGQADKFAYTVTATVNNSAYGTVSVNNNHVTAFPNTGYRASGYRVVSGTPTVVQNGDVFTLTATGNCAIQVIFEKMPTYTVKFQQDIETVSSQTVAEGNCVVLPSYFGDVPNGYTFYGWVDTVVYNTSEKPTNVYFPGAEYTVQEDTTFYALLSWVNMDDTSSDELTYKPITQQSQLVAGASVVIVAAGYDKALATTQNSNNRSAVDVKKGTESLVFTTDGVEIIKLEAGTVSGTFGLKTSTGYLYAAGSNKNNYLRTKAALDANGSFQITLNENGSCTIVATGTNSNNSLQYNQQSNIFACYSTTQKPVTLYVGEKVGTTYYTMAWTYDPSSCNHTETTTITVDATCTTDGSITVVCATCGEEIGSMAIPAGHTRKEEVIAPTLSAGGYTRVYCGVCGEEIGQKDSTAPLTDVQSWNLTLEDNISVNFKINVDDSIVSTAKVHIAVGSDAKVYDIGSLVANDDGTYIVSTKVAAARMTEAITVKITNGADTTEEKTYSIKTYAQTILDGNYPETTKNLVKAMLHYGAAAQNYFNYKTNDLANAGVGAVTSAAPATANIFKTVGSADGVEFYGATLVFRDRIALRYYFTVTGDISQYTFTVSGKEVTPVHKGNQYYVEIADINPQDLDTAFTVKVNDTLSVTYSPMNYVVNMHKKGTEDLQALMQALCDYHTAAVAYLAEK